jgi:hypothetical protein
VTGEGTEDDGERAGDTTEIRDTSREPSRGRRRAERLRGRGDVAMTTDEIMALTRAATSRRCD